MKKSLVLIGLILGISSTASTLSAVAKSSYELDNEANKLKSHAANKEVKSAAEESESSIAIDEGKRGTAAKHADRAAKEQKVANHLEKKADKVENRADKKAVKEAN